MTGLPPLLRAALARAGFTYDGVAAALGTTAHTALSRNETTPGLRATTGGSPVETLTRLWLLQATCPGRRCREGAARPARPALRGGLARALGRRGACPGRRTPLCRRRPRPLGGQRPDARPRRRPTRVAADHVLGISSAATSLAQLTVREPVAAGAGPGHRLRRPGAAPRRACTAGGGHGRQPACAVADPVQRRAERRRRARRGPRGQLLRAGGRRPLRPGRDQPAVRDLAGHRGAARLPRLRAARRPRRRAHRPRRCRTC